MLVHHRARFGLKRRERVLGQCHRRMPHDTLAEVPADPPIDEVLTVPIVDRRVSEKRRCRIARKQSDIRDRDERLQRHHLGRRQKKQRRPDPMSRSIAADFDGLVVAVDVSKANRPVADQREHRS
jgi:hypothetical protein